MLVPRAVAGDRTICISLVAAVIGSASFSEVLPYLAINLGGVSIPDAGGPQALV